VSQLLPATATAAVAAAATDDHDDDADAMDMASQLSMSLNVQHDLKCYTLSKLRHNVGALITCNILNHAVRLKKY